MCERERECVRARERARRCPWTQKASASGPSNALRSRTSEQLLISLPLISTHTPSLARLLACALPLVCVCVCLSVYLSQGNAR